MKTLKNVQVSALILACIPINVTRTDSNGKAQHYSHRLTLASSPSFEKAIAQVEKLGREDGKGGFCLKRDDGKYVIDLKDQQASYLAGTCGATASQLGVIAKGATYEATIEYREEGEDIVDRRTGDILGQIQDAHSQIQSPSLTITPQAQLMLLTSGAMVSAFTQSFAQQVAPVAAEEPVIVDDTATETAATVASGKGKQDHAAPAKGNKKAAVPTV